MYIWRSGAQGEYAGLRVIKSYLESLGQSQRNVRYYCTYTSLHCVHKNTDMTFLSSWTRRCTFMAPLRRVAIPDNYWLYSLRKHEAFSLTKWSFWSWRKSIHFWRKTIFFIFSFPSTFSPHICSPSYSCSGSCPTKLEVSVASCFESWHRRTDRQTDGGYT